MEERIRTLIVDDEPLARTRIRQLLEEEADVQVVGECRDGREAVERLREDAVDLVFLDVQMPEMDGFEVVRAIGTERMPLVVFTTAYDAFALRAFESRALDYLLKPIEPARFRNSLDRARALLRGSSTEQLRRQLHSLLDGIPARAQPFADRLTVTTGDRILLLRTREIDWIEAEGNYLRLHARGKSYLMRETMGGLEARLDPGEFLRIHRSRIVNVERVRELEPLFKGEYVLILEDGTKLESGRSFRDAIRSRFRLG